MSKTAPNSAILSCQKHKFDLAKEVTYLNCAYLAPLSKLVAQAGVAGVRSKCQPYEITVDDFFEPAKKLRTTFAQLINAPEVDRIALIPSVSYGISTVANNLKIEKGKSKIILVDEQFPSNYYPWKRAADAHNLEIVLVKAPEITAGRTAAWNQAILDAIDDKTIAIAMGNVHWADGTLFDLAAIRAKSRRHNAIMLIDGTQSVGALPFDLQKVEVDALICASYKWLMGPYSSAYAYYGAYFDDGKPLEENWINRLNSEDFTNLVNYQSQYNAKAQRYNMGQSGNFINIPMNQKALEQLLEWQTNAGCISDYCDKISAKAVEELQALGCQLEASAYRAKHLFGVRLPAHINKARLSSLFQKEKIFVSQRGNAIRIAPNVYNDEQDFDRLVDCFKRSTDAIHHV